MQTIGTSYNSGDQSGCRGKKYCIAAQSAVHMAASRKPFQLQDVLQRACWWSQAAGTSSFHLPLNLSLCTLRCFQRIRDVVGRAVHSQRSHLENIGGRHRKGLLRRARRRNRRRGSAVLPPPARQLTSSPTGGRHPAASRVRTPHHRDDVDLMGRLADKPAPSESSDTPCGNPIVSRACIWDLLEATIQQHHCAPTQRYYSSVGDREITIAHPVALLKISNVENLARKSARSRN
jgi:hypothetical protein